MIVAAATENQGKLFAEYEGVCSDSIFADRKQRHVNSALVACVCNIALLIQCVFSVYDGTDTAAYAGTVCTSGRHFAVIGVPCTPAKPIERVRLPLVLSLLCTT